MEVRYFKTVLINSKDEWVVLVSEAALLVIQVKSLN